MNNENELKGLGGWLILVGIGVVIGPFRLAYEFGPTYFSIFTNGTWEALTTAESEHYNSLWAPFLIGEVLYNSCMVIVLLFLIYLFFSKHYLFPKFYIGIVIVSLIFIPLDAWIGSILLPNEPVFDPNTKKEFLRTLVGGVIWVPYMLVSKRVKLTFVEKMPNNQIQPAPKSGAAD